jgi:hypothetical protein
MIYRLVPMRVTIWSLVFFLCGFAVSAPVGSTGADLEERSGSDEITQNSDEILPHYKGEGSFYLGFRAVNIDAAGRSAEYEDGKSSIALGIDGLACPLPHRYHMHLEYFGEHNNYADFGYA